MERTITRHDEEINKLVNQIVSNSKDAKWAAEMLRQLKGLYQMDKLIDVPLKDVKGTIDLGPNEIHKVVDGYVFVAKGGMETHVSWRLARVCAMFNTLFELNAKADKTEIERSLYDSFAEAICYVMQAPIFSSLDERALFQNATNILVTFKEYSNENFSNAEVAPETEQDIRDNIEAERMAQGIEALAKAPLPPED